MTRFHEFQAAEKRRPNPDVLLVGVKIALQASRHPGLAVRVVHSFAAIVSFTDAIHNPERRLAVETEVGL